MYLSPKLSPTPVKIKLGRQLISIRRFSRELYSIYTHTVTSLYIFLLHLHSFTSSKTMVSGPRAVARRRTQATNSNKSSSRERSNAKNKDDNDYGDTKCEECGSGDYGSELLLCDQCDRGFHLFCLRPILASVPIGSWFCRSCSTNRKTISSMSFFFFNFS